MNNIVSVVMTAFNSEKFVENSIKSVLSQSEKNFYLNLPLVSSAVLMAPDNRTPL